MLSDWRTAQGVRPSPLFLAIVAITAVAGWMTTTEVSNPRIAVFVFIAGAWTLTLVFHEFAHAFLAWRGGDTSIPGRGYLTLDPRRYTHPVMSFILPLLFIIWGGIGLPGGAVQLNRSVLSDSRATLVAIAGPLTNLAAGVTSLLLVGQGVIDRWSQPTLATALAFFGFLQIAVFVLNMLPIPGFDGYAAIEPTLSRQTQDLMRPVATYGPLIAILVIFYVDPARAVFFDSVSLATGLFGIDSSDWSCGFHLFRFWQRDIPSGCL